MKTKSTPTTSTSKVATLEAHRATAQAKAEDARVRAADAASQGDPAAVVDWQAEQSKQLQLAAAFVDAVASARVLESAASIDALRIKVAADTATIDEKMSQLQAHFETANKLTAKLLDSLKAIQVTAAQIDEQTFATAQSVPTRDPFRGMVAAGTRARWVTENLVASVLAGLEIKPHDVPNGAAAPGSIEESAAEAMRAQLRQLREHTAHAFAPPEIVEPSDLIAGQAPVISQSSHAVLARASQEHRATAAIEQESLS